MPKKIVILGDSDGLGFHISQALLSDAGKFDVELGKKPTWMNPLELEKFLKTSQAILYIRKNQNQKDFDAGSGEEFELFKKIVLTKNELGHHPPIFILSNFNRDFTGSMNNFLKEHYKDSKNNLFLVDISSVYGPFCTHEDSIFGRHISSSLSPETSSGELGEKKIVLHYVDDFALSFLKLLKRSMKGVNPPASMTPTVLPGSKTLKAGLLHKKLRDFKNEYLDHGRWPTMATKFEKQLFISYHNQCFYDIQKPGTIISHRDPRGSFAEVIRTYGSGQASYSITLPGITRGNHYHTRKLERFVVIKGKAVLKIRKINSDKIIEFNLSGSNSSFVDIPVWHTHSITNVGTEDLITLFWTNEMFNPLDPDTHLLDV